jgi:hypothetical protein
MQWYHKDNDPRMDERSARLHSRMIKKFLEDTQYNLDVNVARASTDVTWDYGKKKWCEVDHLMFNLLTEGSPNDTREDLENRLCSDIAVYLNNFKLYKQAKVYVTTIDLEHPEWDYGKDKGVGKEDVKYYHTTVHIQECNATDLAIREHDHNFFDLTGQDLLEVA